MSDRKAVIKNADMSEEMQQDAVAVANQALEKFNIEKDIAAYIKKEFDKKHSPTWHCIVGRNFGRYFLTILPTFNALFGISLVCPAISA